MKKLIAPGGPLGVFAEYPVLARFAVICFCAETAWALLIVVLQFHFAQDLFPGEAKQIVVARIATITLAFVGCEALFKIPMGELSDRIGPRPVIFFALGIAALSPLLMTQATQWYTFVPLRMMDGLGAAALWPSMSSLMARAVPREAKAAAMSVFNGAYCLALAIGPMTGLFIGERYGNTRVFPLCSIILLIGLFIAWTVLRGQLGARPPRPAGQSGEDSSHGVAGLRALLRGRPMLGRMLALYALSQGAVGLFAVCAVPYIAIQFGIQEVNLPRLIALPAILVALIALPLGRLGDSIGRARAVYISCMLVTVGMFLTASTSLFRPDRAPISLPLAIFGIGIALMVGSYILGTPAWLGLTSLLVDDSRQARTLSLMQTAQGLGIVVSSAVVASAGQVLGKSGRFVKSEYMATGKWVGRLPIHHFHNHFRMHVHMKPFLSPHDVVPISDWLWLACILFAVCLVGTLMWVRDPQNDDHQNLHSERKQQPVDIAGV